MDKTKIAILTTFNEFLPGYSLTGIVKDQCRMLTEHGNDVHLFVNEKYHGEEIDGATIHPEVPFTHLIDYKSVADLTDDHAKIVERTQKSFEKHLADMDYVFTHDFVFLGWNVPYFLGMMQVKNDVTRWLHWIHSVPSDLRDWWDFPKYFPQNGLHKLIYPNASDKVLIAEQWRTHIGNVRTIPHIKDMRTWFEFNRETCKFIRDFPMVMQADVVCVYPASTDRLEAKRVKELISIMGNIKAMNKSVFFCVANQWATGKKQREDLDPYKQHAKEMGLRLDEEFTFTSDWQKGYDEKHPERGKFDVGLPQNVLRELLLLSNLFIFPTREESFGLVSPEASLCGAFTVLNRDLDQLLEISGFRSLNFNFGSNRRTHNIKGDPEKYWHDLAWIIMGAMSLDHSLKQKTYYRQTLNYDYLYAMYYAQIMAESVLWG